MVVVFDNHYLNLCCKPKTEKEYARKLANKLLRDPYFSVIIPAVVVYEVRRGYLYQLGYETDPVQRSIFQRSIERLDFMIGHWGYSPLTKEILNDAAQLWADNLGTGQPNAHPERIDIDVIIAAEALRRNAHVWTQNERHFRKHGLQIAEL